MGEIVEMILEGILCELCGGYIDDNYGGYPRKCSDCLKDEDGQGRSKRKKLPLKQKD
jgi:hypothetical protein